jgi:hypothetical protein
VLGLRLDPQVAVFGTLIVLGLMFVLVVFSRYAGEQHASYIGPAVVLVWFYTIAVIVATTLFMTSYFAQWPLALSRVRAASLPSGSATLYDGFKLGQQSVFNFASGNIEPWGSPDADIGVANPDPNNSLAQFFVVNDSGVYTDPNATHHNVENAGIVDMSGVGRLDQVLEAPTDGYRFHYFVPSLNRVYCVRTRDGDLPPRPLQRCCAEVCAFKALYIDPVGCQLCRANCGLDWWIFRGFKPRRAN